MACCSSSRQTARVVLDLALFIIVLAVYVGLLHGGEPPRPGWVCGDLSISYPHKHTSVSYNLLITVASIVTATTIVLIEMGSFIYTRHIQKPPSALKKRHLVKNLYRYLGTVAYIHVITQVITRVTKVGAGGLRPNFVSVCAPDYSRYPCDGYLPPEACTGDPDHVTASRMSFVSGHSSTAMALATYLALYLHHRVRCSSSLLPSALQVAVFCPTLYAMCTRVSDYKHHLSDVIVGGACGAAVALVLSATVGGMWGKSKTPAPPPTLPPPPPLEVAPQGDNVQNASSGTNEAPVYVMETQN